MINESKKIEFLGQILNSKEFKDSKSYKILLKYLVESTLSGLQVTEQMIASEGLGKKGDFDTSVDASVRVYIHNLRKKLASYYMSEGKNDEVKISIPKGHHYLVTFTEQKSQKRKQLLILLNFIAILVIILLNILYLSSDSNKTQNAFAMDPVWTEYFTNELPVLIVIGDYFVFKDNSESSSKYIRDIKINSEKDFDEMIRNKDTSNKYAITEITYLGKFALWTFKDILPVFINQAKKYDVKLASEVTWEDLNHNNIVFIGSFKSLYIMSKITNGLSSSYQVHPNSIVFHDQEKDSVYNYSAPKNSETGYLKDYTLVAKLPGPNKNVILMFSSTHDIGHISTVSNFVNIPFLKKFESQFINHSGPLYFEAIFEVEGFERTGFYPKLIQAKEVPADYKFTQ